MRKFRYQPNAPKKQDYSKLFNDEDNAQLLYFHDAKFRKFVDEKVDDVQTIPFGALYRAYEFENCAVQLSLF